MKKQIASIKAVFFLVAGTGFAQTTVLNGTCFRLSTLFPRLSFGLQLAVLASGLLTFAFSLQVRAADVIWVGDDNASNGAWSRTGNWANNTTPNFQTSNRIVFQNNLRSNDMLYDLGGWVDASDIIWDTTFNVSRTLNSTAGGINFATRVENNSAYTQTVSMNLSGGKFGATGIELNPVNGDLVINGTIFNDNSRSYNIWGNTGRTLTLNSTLGPNANQSGVAFTIQRNTTVVLNANQLWQGTTTMNGGTLLVGSGLLGNGTYSGDIVMNSFSGTNASLIFSNSAAQTLSGAISGSGSFTMAGSGTTTLSGNNTYTGATAVNDGSLAVNGSLGNTAVSVGSNATLQGSGSIGGSVTINSLGTLSAGNSIESLAMGTLTLQSGSNFIQEVDSSATVGSQADLVVVNGNLNIANEAVALTLTDLAGSWNWVNDTKLTMINYSGTWNGGLFVWNGDVVEDDSNIIIADGKGWRINYNDTTGGSNYSSEQTYSKFVTLTAVPEPTVVTLGGLGALLLLRRRRA